MEIHITSNHLNRKKKIIVACGLLVSVAVLFGLTLTQVPTPEVAKVNAHLLRVEQADFELTSLAYGEFFSAKEMMLTAQAAGRVKAIHLQPGSLVTKDSVILTLSNPELQQQFQSEKGELTAKQAEMESFELEQKNARLDHQGKIATIEAELEQAQLNLRVNKELSERGVSTKMDILRGELAVKQLLKRQGFERQKYQQFVQMQAFQLKQKKIAVEQQQQKVNLLSQKIRNMDVTAGINGTLQQLEINLGESVSQGANLGQVGSDTDLLARLRVPEHHADQISIGASVTLTTRKGQVKGEITRIESVVNNGVVLAEAKILGALPVDARPASPLTGNIYRSREKNALFVEQAPGLRPRSQLTRFVANQHQTEATARTIILGEDSDGKILITSGLKAGEYLLAEMKESWKAHPYIKLK